MKAKNFEKLKLTTENFYELINLSNGVMFKKEHPELLRDYYVTPFEELISISKDVNLGAKIANLTFAQADFLLDHIIGYWLYPYDEHPNPHFVKLKLEEVLIELYKMSSDNEPEKQEWVEQIISNCCDIIINENIAKITSYRYYGRHSLWHIVALISIPYDIKSNVMWDGKNENSECVVMEVELDLLKKIAPKTVLNLDVNKYNI